MDSKKYIGKGVHQATISVANYGFDRVGSDGLDNRNEGGDESGVHRGTAWERKGVTFGEGTGAGWLCDLVKPQVMKAVVVCDPWKNPLLKAPAIPRACFTPKTSSELKTRRLEPS